MVTKVRILLLPAEGTGAELITALVLFEGGFSNELCRKSF